MSHIHEKIDFVVDVYVVYRSKVLLRFHDKYKRWFVPGGHIELDEHPNQAALREVKEETGLEIELYDKSEKINTSNEYTQLVPPQYLNMHPINDQHKHCSLIYFASAKTHEVTPGDIDDKSESFRWLNVKELNAAQDVSELVKFYGTKALEVLTD